jgi:chromosome partitioning protein
LTKLPERNSRERPTKKMAVIYAIANQKGGVGKTTTAINLSATLAQAGEKILLIDLDPQANASHGLGVRVPKGEPSTLEVLLGEVEFKTIIRESPVARLDIAPSSTEMAGAEVLLPGLERREHLLERAVRSLLDEASYGYVFIDCPPSLGLLTVNALVAAHQVIVPVQAEYFALEGLAQLLSTITAVRERLNPSLRIGGLVLTMVDVRTSLARQVEHEVRTHFPNLSFKTIVPRNVRLAEAPSHGLPVSMVDPYCVGSEAYFNLALEVVKNG